MVLCHFLTRLEVSKSNKMYRFIANFREDMGNYPSLRVVVFICFLETLLMPVLLLEMVILELTVYRFPRHYAGILLCSRPFEAFSEINRELLELLIDIPFLLLFLLALPLGWRSHSLIAALFHRRLNRFSIPEALVWALCDLVAVTALAVVYITLLRVGTFLQLYREQSRRQRYSFWAPFHIAAFRAFVHLLLDLLHLPFAVLASMMPWRYTAIYAAITTVDDPFLQRELLRTEVSKGLLELGHVALLLPFAVFMPWELRSLRTFRALPDIDLCQAIRLTIKAALLDLLLFPLVLIAVLLVIHAKHALSVYFSAIEGRNRAEIALYWKQRLQAVLYYALCSLCMVAALLGQLVLCLTMWRVPTLYYVIMHLAEIRPQFEEAVGVDSGNSPSTTPPNPLLFRSKTLEAAIGCSLLLCWEWVKDLPYVPLALLTPPWRLVKWVRKVWSLPFDLKAQKEHRRSLLWSSKTGCLDILSLFASIVLVLTLWRIVFFHRLLKKNAHLGYKKSTKSKEYLSFQYCVLITFREWLKDLPYVPIGLLISVFACWRLPQIVAILIGQAERIPTIKEYKSIASERQKLLKMLISVLFFDYPTLIMTAVLLISLWRAVNTLSLLKLHVLKYFKDLEEEVDSTLFREITAQFCQLGIDFLELLMMFTVLILGVRASSLIRRMRIYTRLYRERKGFYTLKVLQSWCPKDPPPPPQVGLASMSKNILFEISSMLELPDLGKLQQTCRYLRKALDHRPIWHFQYITTYSQYLEKATYSEVVHAEYDYKHLAIEGYKECKRQRG